MVVTHYKTTGTEPERKGVGFSVPAGPTAPSPKRIVLERDKDESADSSTSRRNKERLFDILPESLSAWIAQGYFRSTKMSLSFKPTKAMTKLNVYFRGNLKQLFYGESRSRKLDPVKANNAQLKVLPLMITSLVEDPLWRVSLTRDLLASGANVRFCDHNGRTALHWAVITERCDVVQILARECEIDLTRGDKYGNTCLHYAVAKGCYKCSTLLVDKMSSRCNDWTVRNHAAMSAITVAWLLRLDDILTMLTAKRLREKGERYSTTDMPTQFLKWLTAAERVASDSDATAAVSVLQLTQSPVTGTSVAEKRRRDPVGWLSVDDTRKPAVDQENSPLMTTVAFDIAVSCFRPRTRGSLKTNSNVIDKAKSAEFVRERFSRMPLAPALPVNGGESMPVFPKTEGCQTSVTRRMNGNDPTQLGNTEKFSVHSIAASKKVGKRAKQPKLPGLKATTADSQPSANSSEFWPNSGTIDTAGCPVGDGISDGRKKLQWDDTYVDDLHGLTHPSAIKFCEKILRPPSITNLPLVYRSTRDIDSDMPRIINPKLKPLSASRHRLIRSRVTLRARKVDATLSETREKIIKIERMDAQDMPTYNANLDWRKTLPLWLNIKAVQQQNTFRLPGAPAVPIKDTYINREPLPKIIKMQQLISRVKKSFLGSRRTAPSPSNSHRKLHNSARKMRSPKLITDEKGMLTTAGKDSSRRPSKMSNVR